MNAIGKTDARAKSDAAISVEKEDWKSLLNAKKASAKGKKHKLKTM